MSTSFRCSRVLGFVHCCLFALGWFALCCQQLSNWWLPVKNHIRNCDSTSIPLRFDYNDSYQNFDSTRQSGHHYSMLMKAWIHTRRHFTSGVCETAIPTSTIEGCYPMFICQRECHSYYYRDVHYCVIICPNRCLLIGCDAFDRRKNEHV